MPYFPMMIDISDKKVLIVGGGKAAFQKVKVLKKFCSDITVSAEKFDYADNSIHYMTKPFDKSDIDRFDMVIGADNTKVNETVFKCCREKGIAVNIVDDTDKSDFMFPAVYTGDSLVVAVSTSGKSPTAASEIRDGIERSLPDNIEDIIEELNVYRAKLKEKGLTYAQRKELLAQYYKKLLQ